MHRTPGTRSNLGGHCQTASSIVLLIFWDWLCTFFLFLILLSSLALSSSTRRRLYPQRSSGQAVVTSVVPSPPRYVPSFLSRIGFSTPSARRFSSNVEKVVRVPVPPTVISAVSTLGTREDSSHFSLRCPRDSRGLSQLSLWYPGDSQGLSHFNFW